ncbi:MAG TPA: hypothetical protein VJK48_06500 [Chlamydiales bacterium]|nr:hypothetical protein [Chlamydiales bacterium]
MSFITGLSLLLSATIETLPSYVEMQNLTRAQYANIQEVTKSLAKEIFELPDETGISPRLIATDLVRPPITWSKPDLKLALWKTFVDKTYNDLEIYSTKTLLEHHGFTETRITQLKLREQTAIRQIAKEAFLEGVQSRFEIVVDYDPTICSVDALLKICGFTEKEMNSMTIDEEKAIRQLAQNTLKKSLEELRQVFQNIAEHDPSICTASALLENCGINIQKIEKSPSEVILQLARDVLIEDVPRRCRLFAKHNPYILTVDALLHYSGCDKMIEDNSGDEQTIRKLAKIAFIDVLEKRFIADVQFDKTICTVEEILESNKFYVQGIVSRPGDKEVIQALAEHAFTEGLYRRFMTHSFKKSWSTATDLLHVSGYTTKKIKTLSYYEKETVLRIVEEVVKQRRCEEFPRPDHAPRP